MTKIKEEDIVARECRFAVYCPPYEEGGDDLHVVKEILHLKDGSIVPNVTKYRNFQRPYYLTRPTYRNHKDKKEWEIIDKLEERSCTQSKLIDNISRALNIRSSFRPNLRSVCESPFVYGADILSTAVLKKKYQDAYPNHVTAFNIATYDLESDVVEGHEEIIMGTLSFGKKVFTAVRKTFIGNQSDVENRLQKLKNTYLARFVEERKFEWEVVLVDTDADVVVACFEKAHEWKPDFVAIWNIDFDIPKSVEALRRNNIDPKNVFCDPSVPDEFKFFDYIVGSRTKVTADGTVKPRKPSEQWHTVLCPASFYFIDPMCAYRQIRNGEQEEQSYSLDAILNKVFADDPAIRKLKFEEANGLVGIDWHQFMQSNHKLEYVIYNVFDCMSMELLDEKTKDLRFILPLMSGCSDFRHFNSQPRRLVDDLHYFCLKRNYVIATTSRDMSTELDNDTVSIRGWIVTLPAHLVEDNGLNIILENKFLKSNARGHVADLDVTGSYPNGGVVFNISKETTHKEMCKIIGISEYQQRMQGINLSGGHVNAVEICTSLYSMPSMETMLKGFQRKLDRDKLVA